VTLRSCGLKTERPVLDRPLKVGGGIQPQLVTVLTPATTFTVGLNCNQNRRAVKRRMKLIYGRPYFGANWDMWRSRRDNLRNFFLSPPAEMLSFLQQLRGISQWRNNWFVLGVMNHAGCLNVTNWFCLPPSRTAVAIKQPAPYCVCNRKQPALLAGCLYLRCPPYFPLHLALLSFPIQTPTAPNPA